MKPIIMKSMVKENVIILAHCYQVKEINTVIIFATLI